VGRGDANDVLREAITAASAKGQDPDDIAREKGFDELRRRGDAASVRTEKIRERQATNGKARSPATAAA
jgi:hypothetical protein